MVLHLDKEFCVHMKLQCSVGMDEKGPRTFLNVLIEKNTICRRYLVCFSLSTSPFISYLDKVFFCGIRFEMPIGWRYIKTPIKVMNDIL